MVRRTRLSEEQRKAQIIEAAMAVATRDGLESATVRAVSAKAGVSHGLVLHHFGSMEGLQSALLDWLLERVLIPQTREIGEIPVGERLMTVLERQLAFFDREPQLMDLLFGFWTRTTADASIRQRIEDRLEAFRVALEPVAASVTESDPTRFRNTTSTAIAQVIGMLLLGHEMQRQLNPAASDTGMLLTAVRAILDQGTDEAGG